MAIVIEVVSDSSKAHADLQRLKQTAINIRDTLIKNVSVLRVDSSGVKKADSDLKDLRKNSGEIKVKVNADTTGLQKATSSLQKLKVAPITVDTTNISRASTDVEKLSDKFKDLAKSIAYTAVAYGSLSSLLRTADAITNLDSKLKVLAKTQDGAAASFFAIRNIALNSRQSIDSVGDLYTKLTMASERLGASQKDVGVVTQTVTKFLAASGAQGMQAQAAIMQLGQALGSGVLQGDELRSIAENAPKLLDVIAKGMGVSREQIRLLGAEGKLTSREVFKALLSGAEEANVAFKKTGVTYEQAFTNIGNSVFLMARAISKINDQFGDSSTGGIASWINDQAKAIARFSDRISLYVNDLRLDFLEISLMIKSTFYGIPEIISDGLTLGLGFISKFTSSAGGLFYKLYDAVIGHSYIPDLVEGVAEWAEKLLGKPIDYIKEFSRLGGNVFKSMVSGDLFDNSISVSGLTKSFKAFYQFEKLLGRSLSDTVLDAIKLSNNYLETKLAAKQSVSKVWGVINTEDNGTKSLFDLDQTLGAVKTFGLYLKNAITDALRGTFFAPGGTGKITQNVWPQMRAINKEMGEGVLTSVRKTMEVVNGTKKYTKPPQEIIFEKKIKADDSLSEQQTEAIKHISFLTEYFKKELKVEVINVDDWQSSKFSVTDQNKMQLRIPDVSKDPTAENYTVALHEMKHALDFIEMGGNKYSAMPELIAELRANSWAAENSKFNDKPNEAIAASMRSYYMRDKMRSLEDPELRGETFLNEGNKALLEDLIDDGLRNMTKNNTVLIEKIGKEKVDPRTFVGDFVRNGKLATVPSERNFLPKSDTISTLLESIGQLFSFDNALSAFDKIVSILDGTSKDIKFSLKDLALPATILSGVIGITSLLSSLSGIKGIIPALGALVTIFTKPLSMGITFLGTGAVAVLTAILSKVIGNPFKTVLIGLGALGITRSKGFKSALTGEKGTFFDDMKTAFDKSTVGHTLKQVFGVQDTNPYAFSNPNSPTGKSMSTIDSEVGRGPFRYSKGRPIGHDLINAIPVDKQLPAAAVAITAAIAGVFKVFGFGTLGKTLATITAVFGGATALKVIDTAEVKRFLGQTTNGIFGIIDKALEYLFEGVLKFDSLKKAFNSDGIPGLVNNLTEAVTALFGIMLFFKSGRETLLKGSAAILSGPGQYGASIADRGVPAGIEAKAAIQDKFFAWKVRSQEKIVNELKTESIRRGIAASQNPSDSNKSRFNKTIGDLDRATSALQRNIETQVKYSGKIATDSNGNVIKDEFGDPKRKGGITDKLRQDAQKFRERLDERATQTKQAIVNASGAVGGALGTVAGFQLGQEIAKGMTGVSDWVKVGVTVGVAAVGQFVGAAAMGTLAATITGAFSLAGSGLKLLFTTTPGLIAVALLAAGATLYTILTDPEGWEKLWSSMKSKIEEAWNTVKGSTIKAFDDWKNGKPAGTSSKDLKPAQKRADDYFGYLGKYFTPKQRLNISNGVDAMIGPEGDFPGSGVVNTVAALKAPNTDNPLIKSQEKLESTIGKWIKSITSFFIKDANADDTGKKLLPAFNNPTNLKDTSGKFRSFSSKEEGLLAAEKQIDLYMSGKSAHTKDKPATTIKEIIDLWRPPSDWRGKGDITQENYYKRVSTSVGVGSEEPLAYTTDTLKSLAKAISSVETGAANNTKVESKPLLADKIFDNIEKATVKIAEFFGVSADTAKEWLAKIKDSFKAAPPTSSEKVSRYLESDGATEKGLREILEKDYKKLFGSDAVLPMENSIEGYQELASKIDAANNAFENLNKNQTLLGRTSAVLVAAFEELKNKIRGKSSKVSSKNTSELIEDVEGTQGGSLADVGNIVDSKLESLGFPKVSKEGLGLDAFKEIATKLDTFEKLSGSIQANQGATLSESLSIGRLSKDITDAVKDVEQPLSIKDVSNLSKDPLLSQEVTDSFNSKNAETFKSANKLFGTKYAPPKFNAEMLSSIDADTASLAEEAQNQFDRAMEGLNHQFASKTDKARAKYAASIAAKNLQTKLDELYANVADAVGNYKKPQSPEAKVASQQFATSFNESFAAGLKEVLKGDSKPKDFIYNLAMTTANDIMSNFLKGLTEGLFGSKTGLLANLVGDQVDFGKSVGNFIKEAITGKPKVDNKKPVGLDTYGLKIDSGFFPRSEEEFNLAKYGSLTSDEDALGDTTDAIVSATEEGTQAAVSGFSQIGSIFDKGLGGLGSLLNSAFNGIGSMFSGIGGGSSGGGGSMLSGITDMFSGAGSWLDDTFSSITSFFGFANGGLIRGPGTGTSDSILAKVSNSEFIVNADSTRKFLPLLTAINDDKLPAFAEGGLVGGGDTSLVMSKIDASSQSRSQPRSEQVFNINVTGDISRQTRNEIQQMLPQIAMGVNHHNKEVGIRR